MNGLTIRGAPVIVAPGKLFLSGEYAVLHGKPAVVAAVSRKVVAQYMPGFVPESAFIRHAVRRAISALGDAAGALPAGSVLVQSAEFMDGERKLGLGSSAATTVASVGAVFEYCGYALSEHRNELYDVAYRAHRDAQNGLGSGADVAASVFGGYVRCQRGPDDDPPACKTLPAVHGLQIVAFYSGSSVSTADMLGAVHDLEVEKPPLFTWLMDELGVAATGFAEAFSRQDVPGVIAAARSSLDAMRELGQATQRPIVTPVFDEVAEIAAGCNGAAKPSGAGGGDVGVAFFATPDEAKRFSENCPRGVTVLDVQPLAHGVLRRRAPAGPADGPRTLDDSEKTPGPG